MRPALLIIDMQLGAFDGVRTVPLADGAGLIDRIVALRDAARAAGVPVVTVQDCGQIGGAYEAGTVHWQLHPRLTPVPGECVVQKRFGSAFRETDLAARLAEMGVDAVVVTGQQSDACVTATCVDALALGIPVVLAADGHGTKDTAAEPAAVIRDRCSAQLAEQGAAVETVGALIAAWSG